MPSALESFEAALNATTLDLLGDTITYTPSGGGPLSFTAIVDYGDEVGRLGGSKVVIGDHDIEVPKSIIAQPSKDDIIDLPKRPGVRFQPKDVLHDNSGDNWVIALKKKPA